MPPEFGLRDKLNNVTVGPMSQTAVGHLLGAIESDYLEAIHQETFDESHVDWIKQHRAAVLADSIERLISQRSKDYNAPMVPLGIVFDALCVKHAAEARGVMQDICREMAKRHPRQADYWNGLVLEHRLYHDIYVKVEFSLSQPLAAVDKFSRGLTRRRGINRDHHTLLSAGDVLDAMRADNCGMDLAVDKLLKLEEEDATQALYDAHQFFHTPVTPLDKDLNEQVLKIFQREVKREVPATGTS